MKYRIFDGEEFFILQDTGVQYYDFEGSYALSFVVDGYAEFWAHEQYESASKRAKDYIRMEWTKSQDKENSDIYELDIILFKGDEYVVYYCPIHNRMAATLVPSYGAENTGFRPHLFITPSNCKKIKVVGNIFSRGIEKTKNRSYA